MTKTLLRKFHLGILGCFLAASVPLRAADDTVIKAMRDELARSIQKLQLNALSRPYFIAYRVDETTHSDVNASFGALVGSSEGRSRTLNVEIRVGDYALDNTNFVNFQFGSSGVTHSAAGTAQLPLEDDYNEIRRQLWVATDSAYKKVLEDFAKKKALLENQTRSEELPDFSHEQPAVIADDRPPATLKLKEAENLARQLSGVFKELPGIFASSVRLGTVDTYTRYVNSEGTSFTRMDPGVLMTAIAKTQSTDGLPLEDFETVNGRAVADLPPKEQLSKLVHDLGTRLERLRTAPMLDDYNGPVLVEGEAAAEVFSQIFAPKLLAARRPLSDNPQLEMVLSQLQDSFLGRMGARVLPEFLTVVDDPTLDEFNHVRLVGGYAVDDEGVPARRTLLIEKGVLKNMLTTRDPVAGMLHSTGNRGGPGPLPSNLIVTAESGPRADEMKSELIKLIKQRAKPYGLLVRRVSNPWLTPSMGQMMSMMGGGMPGGAGLGVTEAYKIYPDGREELLRNAELVAVTAVTFKDILLASKDQTVYSNPFSAPASLLAALSSGEGVNTGGLHILSFVVPSLLFDDLTVRRPVGEFPNLPVAKHPFFDK